MGLISDSRGGQFVPECDNCGCDEWVWRLRTECSECTEDLELKRLRDLGVEDVRDMAFGTCPDTIPEWMESGESPS